MKEYKETEAPKKILSRKEMFDRMLENVRQGKVNYRKGLRGVDLWILERHEEISSLANENNYRGRLTREVIKGFLESNGYSIDSIKDSDDLMKKLEYIFKEIVCYIPCGHCCMLILLYDIKTALLY